MRHAWVVLVAAASGCILVTDVELDHARDRDRDGYVAKQLGGDDCDDADGSVHPDAAEICGDGVDNDCDLQVDDVGVGAGTFWLDLDGDGYGDPRYQVDACTAPEGFAARDGDCDDGDGGVHPGATDGCDGVDTDCDGAPDSDATQRSWYADVDHDTFGDEAISVVDCVQPTGWVADATDCDDRSAAVHPGVSDGCDGVDSDCDGTTDENATTFRTWYYDGDHDGYGTSGRSLDDCAQPADHVAATGDCDDGDRHVNPGVAEVCRNGIDDDCDGTATGCELAGTLSLADADTVLVGTGRGEYGKWLYVDDVDADGYDDVIVGAGDRCTPGWDSMSVFLGGLRLPAALSPADASIELQSNGNIGAVGIPCNIAGYQGREFVWTVESLDGQTSCDVYGDVSGAVVFAPPLRLGVRPAPAMTAPPNGYYTQFSASASLDAGAAECADFSGDGREDLLMTQAYGASSFELAYGLPVGNAPFPARTALPHAMREIAGAGRLDQDSAWEAVFSTYDDVVTIRLGGASTQLVDIAGETGDRFGRDAAVGDINGDGQDDLLVAAPARGAGGTIFVFFGPLDLTSPLESSGADVVVVGSTAARATEVAVIGDLNGDGFREWLVMDPEGSAGAQYGGEIRLFYGQNSLPPSMSTGDANVLLTGAYEEERASGVARHGGDLDGDGFDDLVVAAFGALVSPQAGRVYVLYGSGL